MSIEDDIRLLRQILTARSIPAVPEAFSSDDIAALFSDLANIRNVLNLFARGNFDSEIIGRNTFAGNLKTLQAHLRHLTWQVQQVANGDFAQRVDFMGEFSTAFNLMASQLEQAVNDLKEREIKLQKAVKDLKVSEERWSLAVQCSQDGIWDVNVDTREAWYSDGFMQMMQYDSSDMPSDLRWETMIHPQDWQQAEDLIKMLDGSGALMPFSIECRLKTPQDNYVWVRIRGMPVKTSEERRMIAAVSNISAHKEIERSLALQAMHDHLTGLPNRYLLNDRLQQLVASAERDGKPFIYVTLDLDFFKAVNDTFGHAAGDLVLVELSKRLSVGLRHTDTAARLGGDEFVVIYSCDAGLEQTTTESVMNRLYENLKPPVLLNGTEYFLKSSAGVAWFPKHTADLSTLFESADLALYKAKNRGKNQYAVYEPGDEMILER